MKVNRKFKVLSKFGMLKRNMAKVLIGYMKANAIENTGKYLHELIKYDDETKDKLKKLVEENNDKFNSIINFMASQTHRVLVKRETDPVLDNLLYFSIKRYMGRSYAKVVFSKKLIEKLESGKYNFHARLIKAKNYHKNGKGV